MYMSQCTVIYVLVIELCSPLPLPPPPPPLLPPLPPLPPPLPPPPPPLHVPIRSGLVFREDHSPGLWSHTNPEADAHPPPSLLVKIGEIL